MTSNFGIKKMRLVGFLIIVSLVGWFVWTQFIDSSKKQSATVAQTSQVEKGTLVISVTAAGQVSASNSRVVSTNVSGVVKKVFVQNDETVKSGAKIAEIELDQESQQTYSQALSAYQSATNTVANAQAKMHSLQAAAFKANQTFVNGKGSDANPDVSDPNYIQEKATWLQAEADYTNQTAVIAQAQTALQSASRSLALVSPNISAPIAGKISGLSLVEGTVLGSQSSSSEAGSGQTIAHVSTNASPTLTVNLSEVDVTKVRLDNKVTITLDALAGKTFTGKVVSLDTIGSVSSGVTSYPAVIAFDTDAPEVFSNMSAQASIITQTKSGVILIPTSAVLTQNGQSTVRVVRSGKEEIVAVETGLSSGTQIEIVSGLSEGDTIVTSTASLAPAQNGGQTTSPFSGMSGPGGGFGGATQIRMTR